MIKRMIIMIMIIIMIIVTMIAVTIIIIMIVIIIIVDIVIMIRTRSVHSAAPVSGHRGHRCPWCALTSDFVFAAALHSLTCVGAAVVIRAGG